MPPESPSERPMAPRQRRLALLRVVAVVAGSLVTFGGLVTLAVFGFALFACSYFRAPDRPVQQTVTPTAPAPPEPPAVSADAASCTPGAPGASGALCPDGG